MSKQVLAVLSCAIAALGAVIYFNFTLFVVQPIGAIPEGVTFVIPRTSNLEFIDSADAICERTMAGVSLLCRASALTRAVDPDEVYARLPYSEWLYSITTGGKSYGR